MEDLVQYQVPESLASFHLDIAVNDLVTWAFPLAQRVQTDVASLVTASSPTVRAADTARFQRDEQALDAERTRFDAMITSSGRSLSANVAPPALPR
jgi:hypothetical protein